MDQEKPYRLTTETVGATVYAVGPCSQAAASPRNQSTQSVCSQTTQPVHSQIVQSPCSPMRDWCTGCAIRQFGHCVHLCHSLASPQTMSPDMKYVAAMPQFTLLLSLHFKSAPLLWFNIIFCPLFILSFAEPDAPRYGMYVFAWIVCLDIVHCSLVVYMTRIN